MIFTTPILMLHLPEKLLGLLIVGTGLLLGSIKIWLFVSNKIVKEFFGELGFLS